MSRRGRNTQGMAAGGRGYTPRLASPERVRQAVREAAVLSPGFAEYVQRIEREGLRGLPAWEEEAVGYWILQGDPLAVPYLVESNLALVLSVAAIYRAPNVPFEEIVAVGNEALWKAARTFDYRIGRFSTYASWLCWRACRAVALEQCRTIRLPVYIHKAANRLRRVAEAAEAAGEGSLDIAELAQRADIPLEHALAAADAPETVSMGVLSAAGEEVSQYHRPHPVEERLRPPEAADNEPEERAVTAALLAQLQEALPRAYLREQEKTVLRHLFGLEGADVLPKAVLARRMGVTRRTVDNTLATALSKLRLAMGAPHPPAKPRKSKPSGARVAAVTPARVAV